jgi:hypothetical protein
MEKTKSKYDNIEELLTTKRLPVFIEEPGRSMFVILPANYFKLVDDKCLTYYNCNNVYATPNVTQGIYNYYICRFAFENDTVNTVPNLYQNLKIELTDSLGTITTLFDIQNYPHFITGLSDNDLKFELINLILQELNSVTGIEVYWETYNEQYNPNSFILITNNPLVTTITLTSGAVFTTNFSIVAYPIYVSTYTPNFRNSNRLIKSEIIDDVLNFTFSKTKYNSVCTTLRRGKIQAYFNTDFLITDIALEYIRKPRKINYNLNTSCELNPNVHEKLIDLAVERIAAIIEKKNLQFLMKNNQRLE